MLKGNEKIISYPHFGIYTDVIKYMLEGLDLNVLEPRPINKEVIDKGVNNSPANMCYPYKIVLGSFMDSLERGATDLIMFAHKGTPCRYKHYWILSKQTLEDLDYEFDMHRLDFYNFIPKLSKLSGKNYFKVASQLKKTWKYMNEEQIKHYNFERKYPVSIGIIGEIYSVLQNDINFNIIKKLKSMDVNVDISCQTSTFLKHFVNFLAKSNLIKYEKHKERKDAEKMVFGKTGGHGIESILNYSYYSKNDFQGVIWIRPLFCGPEAVVEPLVDILKKQYKTPLLTLDIDENISEVNLDNRLEAFIEMIKHKREVIKDAKERI